MAPGGYQGEDADVLARAVLTRGNPQVCAAAMDRIEPRAGPRHRRLHAVLADRDYVGKADRVKASVFVTHGLEDWNVKTKHFAQWWDALGRRGRRAQAVAAPGGHGSSRNAAWTATVHRWIDHYLYGVDNGIDGEQKATVERADGTITSYASWPDPAARRSRCRSRSARPGRSSPRRSSTTARSRPQSSWRRSREASPNRLAYTTSVLANDLRLSGTPRLELRASIDNASAANVTALLVDYAPDGTLKIVTRGWTDPRNRGSAAVTQPVQPGQLYWLRFDQQPKDHVFAAGHRIGLVIMSTDFDYTLRPKPGTRISVRVDKSTIRLPLVG